MRGHPAQTVRGGVGGTALATQPPHLLSHSVLGKCSRDLLVQLYLQRPDLRVPLPDVLLHSQGATGSSVCKVRPDGLLGAPGSSAWG